MRGAGDLATGVAARLMRAGFQVVLADIAEPTCIRRTVAFCEAVRLGECQVEDLRARLAGSADEARAIAAAGEAAVLVDPAGALIGELAPDAVVDAILAKRNLGTTKDMAPIVVGVGPGFTAPVDCHACVETKRGHYLGRVIWEGSPIPNSGIPGLIAGVGKERVLKSPAEGEFVSAHAIGDLVEAGDVIATVDGVDMATSISGCLRGLLSNGIHVTPGFKCADVDPRGIAEYCNTISDKATAIGGGVLEALCALSR